MGDLVFFAVLGAVGYGLYLKVPAFKEFVDGVVGAAKSFFKKD